MEKDNEIKNKIVQTYAEDMAKVLEDDKSGLIKKIIHEEEKHEIEKRNLSPESKKNNFLIFLSFLFILLGLVTLSYFIFTEKISTIPIEKQFVPLIFNDASALIEVAGLARDGIAQIVYNTVSASKVKKEGLEGIYLVNNKKSVGLREFIQLIKSSFIPDDNELFVQDNFLMGVVNAETKDFFILLKVRSTADIFDSLRAWENKIFFDLRGFFGFDMTPETKYLLTKGFQDGIVENKNARILYDDNNKIVIMYILADDNSVIITNTENAAQEIMLRLATSRVKK